MPVKTAVAFGFLAQVKVKFASSLCVSSPPLTVARKARSR